MQRTITPNYPANNFFSTSKMFVLLITALFFFAGCDTVTEDSSGDFGPEGGMSAKVDGQDWDSDVGLALSNWLGDNVYYISAWETTSNVSGSAIALFFTASGTGTYEMGDSSLVSGLGEDAYFHNIAVFLSSVDDENGWVADEEQGNGSVKITTLTETRIAGTFSFSAPADEDDETSSGTKIVTNGKFDFPFSVEQ